MKFLFIVFTLISWQAIAHPGVGIVMDSRGNVYYTDLKQVWRIDPQGRKQVVVPNVHTHELAIDKDDNLFGEHLWYEGERSNKWGHLVWMLSADGEVQQVINPKEGFLSHYSFVRDSAGNMFWANRDNPCQQIIRKDKRGHEHSYGNPCLNNIRWMTSSAGGTIYAVDLYDLKKVTPAGKVSTLSVQLQEKSWSQFFVEDPHQLMGLCVDAQENVYVACYGGREVKKISATGKVTTAVKTNVMWSPTGVWAAPNGDLWVLECTITNAVRVERFKKNGERVVY